MFCKLGEVRVNLIRFKKAGNLGKSACTFTFAGSSSSGADCFGKRNVRYRNKNAAAIEGKLAEKDDKRWFGARIQNWWASDSCLLVPQSRLSSVSRKTETMQGRWSETKTGTQCRLQRWLWMDYNFGKTLQNLKSETSLESKWNLHSTLLSFCTFARNLQFTFTFHRVQSVLAVSSIFCSCFCCCLYVSVYCACIRVSGLCSFSCIYR